MGLAGPVTGDADEDDGLDAAAEGGDASAGLSLPRLKYLSILAVCFCLLVFFPSFSVSVLPFMSGLENYCYYSIDLPFSFEAV